MTNSSIERAMAAMQLAQEQQRQDPQRQEQRLQEPHKDSLSNTASKTNYPNNPQNHRQSTPANSTPSHATTSTATNSTINSATEATKGSANNLNTTNSTSKDMGRVDISIAGTTHRMYCPSNAVANLKKHSDELNHNLREIRRQAAGKSLNNEELLVLHCFDLYDEIQNLKTQIQNHHIEQERSHALIDKMLKNTHAILGHRN